MPLNRLFLSQSVTLGVEPWALYKVGRHFVLELWFSPHPTLPLSFKDTEIERK